MLKPQNRGFSLVELSIVLVILGLLVGGILAGQSLIRASELRSVGTDLNKYRTAIYAFKDKYFALPGDMSNAVKFWGAQAGATTDGIDTTCRSLSAAATGTLTCNGNADGYINAGGSAGTDVHERYRFWQHLSNAGLIEGTFSGVYGAASTRTAIIGVNVPQSRIPTVGYTMYDDAGWGYRNLISVGASFISGGVPLETASIAFKNEDVWNLDQKTDDGKPFSGRMRTPQRGFFGANCPVSNSANSDYDLSITSIACWFNYLPLQ